MAAPETLHRSLAPDRESSILAPSAQTAALACPVCSSSHWTAAPGVRGVSLSRCTQCGLLGTTHFVTGSRTTNELYDVDAANLAEYQAHYLPHRLAFYARFLPELESFRRTGRLLEVGSGYGYFIEMAAKAHWQSEGVEISPYCCQIAAERGCKIRQSTLEDANLATESYDVVVLWDVIEHFTHPDEIIHLCRGLLRPGGALIMRTPDGRALASTVWPTQAAYRHLVYPANTPEHTFHFTPENLSALVTREGFDTSKVDSDDRWNERVISGNNLYVRAARRLIMGYAALRHWPYEFVLTAVKA
jgi:2-polyprenyl-3-methyl-5-hydroxy-6-metoxy-1,4-benzoquinol methylase